MASALVALTIAWSGVPGSSRGLGQIHAWLGWSVMALGIAQILSALLRGSKGGPTGEGQAIGDLSGDHYDMTWRRVWFERWHKLAGLAAAFLSFLSIATGLVIADGPRWMALVLLGWWVLLVGAAAWLQSRGRCIDTYQAIWGPDSALPGNKRAVIGIFVRRL